MIGTFTFGKKNPRLPKWWYCAVNNWRANIGFGLTNICPVQEIRKTDIDKARSPKHAATTISE